MNGGLFAVLASGLGGSVSGIVVLAGTVVLMLMVVALGTYAYKHLRGEGVEWPEDKADATDEGRRPESDDELERGGEDDEWKYY